MARAVYLVDIELDPNPTRMEIELKQSALGLLQTILDKHMSVYDPVVTIQSGENEINYRKAYSEADVKLISETFALLYPEPEFVDKYYQMDPETEDLIHGADLQNGMRVLFEGDHARAFINDESLMTESNRARAMEFNRWMTVEKLAMRDQHMSFIGVYDDGMKKLHQYDSLSGWYVKKDTLPDHPQKIKPADIWDKVNELTKFVQELDQTFVPIAEFFRTSNEAANAMMSFFEPEEIYTEETLTKVLNAIVDCDISFNLARDIVGTIQNAGILFRERAKVAPDDPSLVNPADEDDKHRSEKKLLQTIATREGDLEETVVDLGKFSSRAEYQKAKDKYKEEHPDYDGGFFCQYDPPLTEDEESYARRFVDVNAPYMGEPHDI